MITISYKNDKLVHLHNILVQPELSIWDTDQDNQLRRRLCPCWYFTINYYCIFHCSWPCHSRNPFWCHLSTFQLSYDAISRSCHLTFFPQQGLIYATLYISLIFKMGKWPISLTNMIIVAISLFSLNIFLNCFIGPMRKQVL